MPVIRILVSFLVVAFGLLFAILMLAAGILGAVLRRLFGRPAAMPQFRGSGARPTSVPGVRGGEDVIDVESTPVKS